MRVVRGGVPWCTVVYPWAMIHLVTVGNVLADEYISEVPELAGDSANAFQTKAQDLIQTIYSLSLKQNMKNKNKA